MPRRKETTLRKRLNERTIERLREIVLSGTLWRKDNRPDGFFDVYGFISGHWFDFAVNYCKDEQTRRLLWDELKADIVAEHIKHKPGTRPAYWWKYEAPEMRRPVGRDRDEDDEGNGEDDGRLPAFEDPNLAEHCKKNYFGRPSIYDGWCYESEREYLGRHGLLTAEEQGATATEQDRKICRGGHVLAQEKSRKTPAS